MASLGVHDDELMTNWTIKYMVQIPADPTLYAAAKAGTAADIIFVKAEQLIPEWGEKHIFQTFLFALITLYLNQRLHPHGDSLRLASAAMLCSFT